MPICHSCGPKSAAFAYRLALIAVVSVIVVYYWKSPCENCLSSSSQSKPIVLNKNVKQGKEAFIAFANANKDYVQLLYILLDSVHLFSTRPVIVFSIDSNFSIDATRHPRVTVQRLSQSDCGPSIYACKLLAMVSSKVDYGIQLESDAVVNYNIDLLFDMLHVWPYDLPLASKHPDDPQNYRSFMQKFDVVHKSTPYLHATFAWTHRAYPFIQEVLALMKRGEFMGANFDETAMNVMLWKAKSNHTLCKYDPYGPLYLEKYETSTSAPACSPYCDGLFLIFHGQKDTATSEKIFKKIRELGPNRPFVQTPQGLKFLNDKGVTCCHPSATRPSPLHPLLCEYHNYTGA